MIVRRACPMCGRTHSVTVNMEEYNKWARGMAYIQEAMPHLSDTEREQILSGLCPTCQNKVFEEV